MVLLRLSVICHCLCRGADANVKNNASQTPLSCAESREHETVAQILLAAMNITQQTGGDG